MRIKRLLSFVLIFVLVLAASFPYDSFVRYRLALACPGLQYESVEASPFGFSLGGVRFPMPTGGDLVLDEVRWAPSALFPPAMTVDLAKGAGRITLKLSGLSSRLKLDASAAALQIQDVLPAFPVAMKMTVSGRGTGEWDVKTKALKDNTLQLTEIQVKTDLGGFAGTGELRPALPLNAATLHIKGRAEMGGQPMDIDKTFSLSDFHS